MLFAPHARLSLLLAALLPACSGAPGGTATDGASATATTTAASTDGMSSTSVGTATATSTSTSSTTTSSTSTSTGVDPTGTTAGESETVDPTCGFICPPDCDLHHCGGDECDVWAQDCPEGEKCSAWANDGGSSWNALKCVPVVPDAGAPGEPCKVEGSPVSGIDTCEKGAMCWEVDPETLEGVCYALCVGTPEDPACADPKAYCALSGDGVLTLCLGVCDPLLQDCDEGEACLPNQDRFTCIVDQSGDAGAQGDPCDFVNACDPGLVCVPPDYLPGCMGGVGCCSAFCDLSDPNTCPDMLPCTPWYQDQPPPGYEDVGVCATPR